MKDKKEEGFEEAKQLIFDLFCQDCQRDSLEEPKKYYHRSIGVYEDAQEFLIKNGMIKSEECQIVSTYEGEITQ